MTQRVLQWSSPSVEEESAYAPYAPVAGRRAPRTPLDSPWELPRTSVMRPGAAAWSEALPFEENFYARERAARSVPAWADSALLGFRAGPPSMTGSPGVGGGWRAFVSGMPEPPPFAALRRVCAARPGSAACLAAHLK